MWLAASQPVYAAVPSCVQERGLLRSEYSWDCAIIWLVHTLTPSGVKKRLPMVLLGYSRMVNGRGTQKRRAHGWPIQ